MQEQLPDLPGWTFEVQEVSNGVYRISAQDQADRRVSRTGDDPEVLLAACRTDAIEIVAADLEDKEGAGSERDQSSKRLAASR